MLLAEIGDICGAWIYPSDISLENEKKGFICILIYQIYDQAFLFFYFKFYSCLVELKDPRTGN